MKVDTNQIEWLLSHATGYQIAKMSGVAQPTISDLINKKRSIENLTIATGHRLTEAAYYLQRETLKANERLISEVLEDISLQGEDFEVLAVVIQDGYIGDYVDANPPKKDAFLTKEEFEEITNNYKQALKSIEDRDTKKMTLQELLKKLETQRIFFDNI